jgi:hypothetical protein
LVPIPPTGEICDTHTICGGAGVLAVPPAGEVCVAVGAGAGLPPVPGVAVFPAGVPGPFDGVPLPAEGPAGPEAGLAEPRWPPVGPPAGAASQVSVYVAGAEAVVTGLVTTSTASPDPDTAGGVTASGWAGWVPAAVKVRVVGAESLPSDRAQY